MAICAVWKKQSYRRYSANVGPLSIEVRRIGLPTGPKWWVVGEVFGEHHHDGTSREKFDNPVDAQDEAERTAIRLLSEVDVAMKYRPWR